MKVNIFVLLIVFFLFISLFNISAQSDIDILEIGTDELNTEINPEKNSPPDILDLPVIGLNNYFNEVKINLEEYVKDENNDFKELKWELETSPNFNLEITDNILVISYDGNLNQVSENIKVVVTDPFGESDSEELSLLYVNIDETNPPIQGMPEQNLFDNRAYGVSQNRGGQLTQYTLNLNPGWNLISLPVVPNTNIVEELLEPLEGHYLYATTYAYNRYRNEFKIFQPGIGVPPEFRTFDRVDESMAFWILMLDDTDLIVNGNQVIESEFKLNKGWNLIGFPSQVELNLDDVIVPINDFNYYFEVIYEYDSDRPDQWNDYNRNKPPELNTLHTLKPGYGYWIYTNYAMKWRYNLDTQKYEFVELDNNDLYNSKSFVYVKGKNVAQVNNNEIRYVHGDLLGSTRAITDDNGNTVWSETYYPFGGQVSATGSDNSIKYTGKQYDYSSGLYYYGSRYMDPNLGRFISTDKADGDLKVPQSLNKYVYALNNPYAYVDSDGNLPRFLQKAWDWYRSEQIERLERMRQSYLEMNKFMEEKGKLSHSERVRNDESMNKQYLNSITFYQGSWNLRDVRIGPTVSAGGDAVLGGSARVTYGFLTKDITAGAAATYNLGPVQGGLGVGVSINSDSLTNGDIDSEDFQTREIFLGRLRTDMGTAYVAQPVSNNGVLINGVVVPLYKIPRVCTIGVCVDGVWNAPQVQGVHAPGDTCDVCGLIEGTDNYANREGGQ
ncbi:hypothetical protein J4471_00180 [Candidatus Woesearchaeota archaeon]|nr:hypothetical protein [Candidatus Woesearchaeota archaeon]